MRVGDLKLVEWFEDGRVELYDLATDPEEAHDLSSTDPTEAARLREIIGRWRVNVNAQMPSANLEWDGSRPRQR